MEKTIQDYSMLALDELLKPYYGINQKDLDKELIFDQLRNEIHKMYHSKAYTNEVIEEKADKLFAEDNRFVEISEDEAHIREMKRTIQNYAILATNELLEKDTVILPEGTDKECFLTYLRNEIHNMYHCKTYTKEVIEEKADKLFKQEKIRAAEAEVKDDISREEQIKKEYQRLTSLGWSDSVVGVEMLKRGYQEHEVKQGIAKYSVDASDESNKAIVYARKICEVAKKCQEEIKHNLDNSSKLILQEMVKNVKAMAGNEPIENVEAYINRTESLLSAPNKTNPTDKEKNALHEYQVLMKDYLKRTGERVIGFDADVAVAKKMYELGYTQKEVLKAIIHRSPKAVCCSLEFKKGEYEKNINRGAYKVKEHSKSRGNAQDIKFS